MDKFNKEKIESAINFLADMIIFDELNEAQKKSALEAADKLQDIIDKED